MSNACYFYAAWFIGDVLSVPHIYDKALHAYNKAIELKPNHKVAWRNLKKIKRWASEEE